MNNFFDKGLNIENIVICCFVPKNTGERIHKNRRSHGLAVNLEGEKIYTFQNGKTIPVTKGDIIFLPKNSSYVVDSLSEGDCYAINFDISDDSEYDPCCIKMRNSESVIDAFRSANAAWSRKNVGYEMKCKAVLYNIICTLFQEHFSEYVSKSKLEKINPAIEYIHKYYTEKKLSVSFLSGLCGITPEYFRSVFRKYYGMSPVEYINDLKLTHAKELLSSGMCSVNKAAEASGFSDLSYFSRRFKQHVGICPAKYAKEK